MSAERIHVKIGELRAAAAASVLYTIGLGSCVAVALYDARARVGGLAHVMLPHTGSAPDAPPGRFAPSAVPMLVDMMVQAGARRRGMFARIAGGAAMFETVMPVDGVALGERNVMAVKEALAKAGVPLTGEDVGGAFGRSVFLDTPSGQLLVRSVRRDDVIL